jgi:class 3 adenylate cyclase
MLGDPSPQTLTFVLTDLESSTRLWEEFPEAMNAAVERHDAILRGAVEMSNGRVVKLTGDGLMAVFVSPAEAAEACLEAQQALQEEAWGEAGPLRVRMGSTPGTRSRVAATSTGHP